MHKAGWISAQKNPLFVLQKLAITLSKNQFEAPLWANPYISVLAARPKLWFLCQWWRTERLRNASHQQQQVQFLSIRLVYCQRQSSEVIWITEHPTAFVCWSQCVWSTCKINLPQVPSFNCFLWVLGRSLTFACLKLFMYWMQAGLCCSWTLRSSNQPDCTARVRGVMARSFEATFFSE